MRRIITFLLLFLSVFVVYGAVQCDSIKVYFALNKATYNTTLNNNAESMEKFIDGIVAAANSEKLDHIAVYGYSSPEGPLLNNDRLSTRRCNVIAEYISSHTGIPRADIRTYPGSVAWEGLRTLVIRNPQTPARAEVLRVLDKYIPAARTDRAMSEQCRNALLAIDNGCSYNWMLENLFPELRYSLAIYSYTVADNSTDEPVYSNIELKNIDLTPPPVNIDEAVDVFSPSFIEHGASMSLPPLHRLALKTNLLYDAALLPNLEVEWLVNNKWSVALEGGIAWWGDQSKCKSYRLVMASAEGKRWFLRRAPWHGLYAGLFAGGGYYDFEKTTRGYRGEGGMAGLSVGYMWPIGRCLSLEAAIGAGYLYTRCKEYKPLDGCLVYQRTKNINYFGPLKVKFSLVWRLWDQNKPIRLKTGRTI